ncbi:MAG: anti-sigma factor [Deltaproteobacteria bacterium]|nr:anti-sigma factor [Deltaproteobacteria bacterium]
MDCSEYVDMISDEIDEELTEARALVLMRHLVRCDGCRSEYSQLLSLSDIVKSSAPAFPHQLPSQFSAHITALIEEELNPSRKIIPQVPAKGNVFGAFLDKARAVSLPVPSLSWSFAASLMLVASLTFYYKGANTNLSHQQMMTDAKVIKASILKKASLSSANNAGSDFSYYVKKHTNALRSKPVNYSNRYGSAVTSYVSFESGALRNK